MQVDDDNYGDSRPHKMTWNIKWPSFQNWCYCTTAYTVISISQEIRQAVALNRTYFNFRVEAFYQYVFSFAGYMFRNYY